MPPSEETMIEEKPQDTPAAVEEEGSDPFLATPQENVMLAGATPVAASSSPLAPNVIHFPQATTPDVLPIKYQRQNKNDNTNPIPDNGSLQQLLKDTLGGTTRRGSLEILLKFTESLPPIVEDGLTSQCNGHSSNYNYPPQYKCCSEPMQLSYQYAPFLPPTQPPSYENYSVSSESEVCQPPSKIMKRTSVDHDMTADFLNVSAGNAPNLFPPTGMMSNTGTPYMNSNSLFGGSESSPNMNCPDCASPEMQRDCKDCCSQATSHLDSQHPPPEMMSIVSRDSQLNVPMNNSRALAIRKSSKKEDKEYIDLTNYLNMPQSEAARRLGIPTSSLSKKWKEAAFDRKWPYRTVCKIDKEIMALLHNVSNPLPPDVEQTLGILVRKRQEELRPVIIRK